jgi:hypothetical protein
LSPGDTPAFDVPLLSATQRLVELPPHYLRDARTGAVPRLKTALRLGLRSGSLIVRFDGRDRGVVATLTQRDAPLWKEDVYEVFLSPFHPPRLYFEFEVNPLGALFDARIQSPDLARATMRAEPAWRCPGFSAKVIRADKRWSALLRIPIAPMLDGDPPQSWRANFYRIDRGSVDEFSAWSPTYADPPDFHVPSRFGFLSFPVSALSSQP